jgi:hypothetical protein
MNLKLKSLTGVLLLSLILLSVFIYSKSNLNKISTDCSKLSLFENNETLLKSKINTPNELALIYFDSLSCGNQVVTKSLISFEPFGRTKESYLNRLLIDFKDKKYSNVYACDIAENCNRKIYVNFDNERYEFDFNYGFLTKNGYGFKTTDGNYEMKMGSDYNKCKDKGQEEVTKCRR